LIKEWFQFNIKFFKEQAESKDRQIAEKDKQKYKVGKELAKLKRLWTLWENYPFGRDNNRGGLNKKLRPL
jgi:formate-dependent nitrite reductase cytochrome c552 subunit